MLVFSGTATNDARAEPAITSALDAACRQVARSRVYTTPDPMNLGLREIGRQIYQACMRQARKPAKRKKRHRRRR